jgi:hypothetical protein
MRALLVTGVVLAAFAGGQAWARDLLLAHPLWTSAPSTSDVLAAAKSRGAGKDAASLRCQVQPDGTLANCRQMLASSDRANAAASSLAPAFRVEPPSTLSETDRLFVDIDFLFGRLEHPPVQLVRPEAVSGSPPGPFPQRALDAGASSGVGVVDCVGSDDGSLTDCRVSEETPGDVGLGELALARASTLKLNLWQEGVPIRGLSLRLPIFLTAAGIADDGSTARPAIFHVAGSHYPGTAGPYYPERASRMHVEGDVTLECLLVADGSSKDCIGLAEDPNDQDFIWAAVLMAQRRAITAKARMVGGHPVAAEVVRVDVPFKL